MRKRSQGAAETDRKRARRLNESEYRERMGLTADQLDMLDRIANGTYVRNAAAIMRAIELKAAAAYPAQPQRLEVAQVPRYELTFAGGESLPAPITTVPDGDPN